MSERRNEILRASSSMNAEMKTRPAIKNNLNEQLKIYYSYRDEERPDRKTNTNSSEVRPLPLWDQRCTRHSSLSHLIAMKPFFVSDSPSVTYPMNLRPFVITQLHHKLTCQRHREMLLLGRRHLLSSTKSRQVPRSHRHLHSRWSPLRSIAPPRSHSTVHP